MPESLIYTNHEIFNLNLATANTEFSQALNANGTKLVSIKSRDPNVDMKFTFVSGESGTKFITIFGGSEWFSRGEMKAAKTIRLQCPRAGTIAEIEEWT